MSLSSICFIVLLVLQFTTHCHSYLQFKSQIQTARIPSTVNKSNNNRLRYQLLCIEGDNSVENIKLTASTGNKTTKDRVDELSKKLTKAGQAGLLAYGGLNFIYYVSVTAFAWYVTAGDVAKGLGTLASDVTLKERIAYTTARLGKVSVFVWAGSQVTKVFRLTGAVLLSPLADKILNSFQNKFSIKNKSTAFWILTGGIVTTTFSFYLSLIFGTVFQGYLAGLFFA